MNNKIWLLVVNILVFWVLGSIIAPAETSSILEIGQPYCIKADGKKREGDKDDNSSNKVICRIGDRVRSSVGGLQDWLQNEKNKLKNLVVSLDGNILAGLTANYLLVVCPSPTKGKTRKSGCEDVKPFTCEPPQHVEPCVKEVRFLQFRLLIEAGNRKAWERVLVRFEPWAAKSVVLAVVDTRTNTIYGGETIDLEVASDLRMYGLAALFVVLLVVAGVGIRKWGFLREPGQKPPKGSRPSQPFSLGSCQMAFWFFLVLGGFLYLWIVTGQTDMLTAGVLGLIGISATTGLSAVAVGATKNKSIAAERDALKGERKVVNQRLTEIDEELRSKAGKTEPKKTALESERETLDNRKVEIEAELANLPTEPKPRTSEGFFRDILVTEGEVSFSRFQLFAWTIVLGVIFCHSVFTALQMPDFSATLLGLMGLSSGTYVGFKFPQVPGN